MDITHEKAKWTIQEASHWYEQQCHRAEWSVEVHEAWERWSADPDNMAEFEVIGRFRAQLSAMDWPDRPLPSAEELQRSDEAQRELKAKC